MSCWPKPWTAWAAVVLVDATKLQWQDPTLDLLPQTRRHSLLVNMLRVPSIVFAVNKLDAVNDASLAFANIGAALNAFTSAAGIPVRAIVRHPRFDYASYAASRATADVALIKLAAPLPDAVVPASLAVPRRVAPGETLTIAGFGVTLAGTARGLGQPRMATLTVTGKPGSLQIRLYDIATRNQRIGLGGCTGDSGAPAYDGEGPLVIGVVSWSTAPGDETGCGGLTGITPLLSYRDWIVDTARKLNSPVDR